MAHSGGSISIVEPMRFLADMGVSTRVVEWLRTEVHDTVHLRDQGLQELPDLEIFVKAGRERRIILTFDLDSGEIASLAGRGPAGVIVFRLRNSRVSWAIERLDEVLPNIASFLLEGGIAVIEDSRYRLRRLPHAQQ